MHLSRIVVTPGGPKAVKTTLPFFDHHASNGPTEAINGRREALRRNALGFRNLIHCHPRSLLHSGALHALISALLNYEEPHANIDSGLLSATYRLPIRPGAMVSTAMRVVNAMPYVVDAEPGLLSAL